MWSMKGEYVKALERAGIKVLDVYRYRDQDSIRIMYRNRVYVFKLGRFYDTVKPEELVDLIVSRIEER